MPTYDFRCPKCSHHFEVNLPFGSKEHPLCPKCKHRKTEKLIAPPAIHFKGTGFFKTDSRKKPAPETKQEKSAPETKKTDSSTHAPAKEEKKPPAKN
ncbi:MAG: zinc ribbon domain-containing protein [Candidatus Peribacteraceae bacterium]|nr:zinc ribbon domain-containing protein [Candidatus Peribacteraceae bacterium]MDD5742926.1 zinc ribbon domain-containing protein [Candidatus Peribacteraceae bacterium]